MRGDLGVAVGLVGGADRRGDLGLDRALPARGRLGRRGVEHQHVHHGAVVAARDAALRALEERRRRVHGTGAVGKLLGVERLHERPDLIATQPPRGEGAAAGSPFIQPPTVSPRSAMVAVIQGRSGSRKIHASGPRPVGCRPARRTVGASSRTPAGSGSPSTSLWKSPELTATCSLGVRW